MGKQATGRMDWIKQIRDTLLAFEKSYRQLDTDLPLNTLNTTEDNERLEHMKDAQVILETLMRRDTPEYRTIQKQ